LTYMSNEYTTALQRLPEKHQILLSVIVLALAFSLRSIIRGDYLGAFASAIAVALGFVCHELSHRSTAMRLGYIARYRIWPMGLLLALLLSFVTLGRVVFAAPGAVVIYPKYYWAPLSRSDYSKIAASGPIANIVIGMVAFILVNFMALPLWIHVPLLYVAYVNLFLALFNLLPIPPLDGATVFKYNIKLWGALFIITVIPFITLFY